MLGSRRGAAALLLPLDAAAPPDQPCLLCARPRAAASRLAQYMAGDPSERLDLLGVTGTNGKSTCVLLLQHLLTSPERPWASLGTLHFDAGASANPAVTPPPIQSNSPACWRAI